jgi:hypothetical protein
MTANVITYRGKSVAREAGNQCERRDCFLNRKISRFGRLQRAFALLSYSFLSHLYQFGRHSVQLSGDTYRRFDNNISVALGTFMTLSTAGSPTVLDT